jgi:hypothetical protein
MRVGSRLDPSGARTWLGADAPEAAPLRQVQGRAAGGALAAAFLAALATACSSSSTSVTSPTSVRCPVTLSLSPTSVEAAGGSGQIGIAVARDCEWQARSEADWIALAAPASGQGEANLGYTAAPNTVVSARRGTVVVNDQRIEIAQAAAACSYALSHTRRAVGAEGGSLSVTIEAQASCAWTAEAQVGWVHIDSGRAGNGRGVVTMSVAPNTGAAREGTVLVAGQRYSISQAAGVPPIVPGCEFEVAPQSESFGAGGGEGRIRVRASRSSCAWSAVSNVSWISVLTGGGSGNGDARYLVAPNSSGTRSGTVTVARATVSVTQSAGSSATLTLRGEVSDLSGRCPNLSFTLAGRHVRTNSATIFGDGCDHVRNERDVVVLGVVQGDGSVLALRVEED